MEEFVRRFFQIYNQFYLLHWQTTKYGRHIAFDEINEELEDLVDRFVESYMGKTGKKVSFDGEIEIKNLEGLNLGELINTYISFLVTDLNEMLSEEDVDLLAIRDEMVALMNKLKFLLRLE